MSSMWIFYSLLSAVFFGIKDIIAKKFLKQNTNPKQIVFEEFFMMLFIVLILFFPLVDFTSYSQFWHLYIIKALFLAAAQILYLILLKSFEISSVSPLLNLSPLMLLILSALFLSEYITLVQFFGIMTIIISTYFLEVTIHHHRKDKPHKFHLIDLKNKDFKFYTLSFLMLLAYSVVAIADSIILDEVNVYTNLYFTSLIIFAVSLVYFAYDRSIKKVFKNLVTEPQTLVISFFTMISNFLVLLAIAVPGALVSLVVPLRRTSTLISALAGGMLFHEKHLKRKFIATIFMLIGVILIVV